jgi:2-dehydro-3-deoxyphosphooctonate aldolase (KDO 8-P synthase)
VIEGEMPLPRAARDQKDLADDLGAQFVFKASYDKANRTSGSSYPGNRGRRWVPDAGRGRGFRGGSRHNGRPLPAEAAVAAEFIDLLQIPAFLCRQTDLIEAAGSSGRAVNVKKGPFSARVGPPLPSRRAS